MHVSLKIVGAAALAAALVVVPGCKKAPPAEAPAAAAPAPPPAPAADPHAAPPAGASADPHGAGGPKGAPDLPPLDDAMRAVIAYPVTLQKAEAYCRTVKELRAAGEKDPAYMARLRAPKPPGNQQAELARWLEGIPPLKALLDKHRLKGLDLVLMPQALMLGRNAYALQRDGSPFPADRVNPGSLELHRADPKRMETLVTDCMADLRVISGH